MAVLTDQELYDVINRHFGDLGAGVVNGMFQIAKRESGGNADAHNLNPATRDDSWGLLQINIRPDANPRFASWDLTDPEVNAQAARILYDAAGPTPWSTYNPEYDAGLFAGSAPTDIWPDQSQGGGSGGDGSTPTASRPLINMSSVNAPNYGTAQAAQPLVPQPLPEPDWKQLGTLIQAGGGRDPFGGAMGASPLIPQPSGVQPLIPILSTEDWRKKLIPQGMVA